MTKSQPKWRSIPDDILFRLTPATTGSAESLCPTTSTVLRAISGDPTARLVIDAYAFRFPVTIVEVLPCV
jgi:hypothetical protein